MKLKQVDLFNQPLPLCRFCGYPKLLFSDFRCEYELVRDLKNFNPFRADWHVDLDEEDRFHKLLAPKILEAAKKALEERPRLLLKIKATRNESWVKSHAVKLRKEISQVSLIGYIIVESWPCKPRVERKEEKRHAESGGSEHNTKKVNV